MACLLENREEVLVDYAGGTLPADRLAQVTAHLDVCAECRVAVEAQAQVWSALEDWEPAPISVDFNRKLYLKIDAEEARSWWQRFGLRPSMGLAAACMVLVVGMLFRVPTPDGFDQKAVNEVIDVNQVDRTLEDIEMFRQLGVGVEANEPEGVL
jgi:anti-sigma factor RsiW